jgi:hypothetical protein
MHVRLALRCRGLRPAQPDVDLGPGFFIGRRLEHDEPIRDLPLYSCLDTLPACAGWRC